jgi:HEAT repeat protein/outer membrane protein assembly factor BamB
MTGRLKWGLLATLFLLTPGLARAQEDPSLQRLRLEVDPHGLSKELANVDDLVKKGRYEDALSLVERLQKDSRLRDGFFEKKTGSWAKRILASFDGELRSRLVALPEAGRAAYDLRHDQEAARLEEAGHGSDTTPLAELLARFPGSSRAPRAAIALAEHELEQGDADAAAAHLELAQRDYGPRLTPEELSRVHRELPLALALAGRQGEAERALDKVPEADRAVAKGLLALGERENGATRPVAPGPKLDAVSWAHDTLDWYEETKATSLPLSEPVLDTERAYVHDGSHAVALSLETGKAVWRTALRPGDDAFHHPDGPCRLALGPSVVACVLPLGALVTLDRASGAVLARVTIDDLKKAARVEDESTLASTVVVSGNVVVLALVAHFSEDEISLLGVDARTGAVLWKTFLVGEQADATAPEPLLAAGPDCVYALSCRGLVASIEPFTGAIVWLRRYKSLRDVAGPAETPFGFRVPGRRMPVPQAEPAGRRKPPRPGFLGFVHGKLVVAPPDAQTFALMPDTGEEAWTCDAPGGTVLGVFGKGVLELRKHSIVLVSAAGLDVITNYEGATLHGHAAVSGNVLLLPLESGIARVDLETKTATLATGWSATNGLFGNVAARGTSVVVAGPSRVVALGPVSPAAVSGPPDAHAACRALADRSFAVREAAQAKLLTVGDAARPELEEAARSSDPEVSGRAIFVLDEIARRDRLASWGPRVHKEWFEGDQKKLDALLQRLTHTSAEVRLGGVRALGEVRDDGVKTLLADLLGDKDARVAGSAAVALLQKGDRTGIALLVSMSTSPSREDRLAAIGVIGQKGQEEDLPILAKALDDDDAEIRTVAILGALAKGGDKALPLAMKALDDKSEAVRQQVGAQVMNMKLPQETVAPLLRKLAKDPLRGVRLAALDQLRPIRLPDAFSAFAEALTDQDPVVQRKAKTILLNTKPEDMHFFPREAIEKALDAPGVAGQQDNDRYHLVQVIEETFISNGLPFAPGPLARAALEAAPEHTQLLDRALTDIRATIDVTPVTSADVALIASLTYRAEAPVRRTAYEILILAKGPDRGRWLLRGLDDPDDNVRDMVKTALPLVTDPDVLGELLQREARAEKPEDQAAAAAILDGRADDKAETLAPVCLRGLSDPDERVRTRAWKRIRDLAEVDEELGLFEPGGDAATRDPAVRRATLWWWKKTHKGETPEAILAGLTGPTGSDRWKAAKKLGDLAAPHFRILLSEPILDGLAKTAKTDTEEFAQRQKIVSLGAILGRELAWKEGAAAAERAKILEAALRWRELPPR